MSRPRALCHEQHWLREDVHYWPTSGNICMQFWADSIADPQLLGVRLPKGTYRVSPSKAVLPGGNASRSSFHLVLGCQQQLAAPFELDFQGSALLLEVNILAFLNLPKVPCTTAINPLKLHPLHYGLERSKTPQSQLHGRPGFEPTYPSMAGVVQS